jgi:hypothetical protein
MTSLERLASARGRIDENLNWIVQLACGRTAGDEQRATRIAEHVAAARVWLDDFEAAAAAVLLETQ